MKRFLSLSKYASWVSLITMITLYPFAVYAIDFITSKEFRESKIDNKYLPIHKLFEKLRISSNRSKRREILNLIIMKQVFEDDILKSKAGGMVGYADSCGIIKKISNDRLEFRDEQDKPKIFILDYDKVPTEKKGFEINESNVHEYTVKLFAMHDRLYKVAVLGYAGPPYDELIETALRHIEKKEYRAACERLEQAAGLSGISKNQEYEASRLAEVVEHIQKGDVLITKSPRTFESLEDAALSYQGAKTEGRHLSYKIKEKVLRIVEGRIRQNRISLSALANGIYNRIVNNLKPESGKWAEAKEELYQSHNTIKKYLKPESRENVEGLIEFFQLIVKAEVLCKRVSEDIKCLERALPYYNKAEQLAKSLLPDTKVKHVAEEKLSENRRLRKSLALNEYNGLKVAIKDFKWAEVKKLLKDIDYNYEKYLDENKQRHIAGLKDIFDFIDKRDKEAALKVAKKLPPDLRIVAKHVEEKIRVVQIRSSHPLGIFFKNYGTYDVKGSISRNEWEWSEEEEECWGGGKLITFKVISPDGKGKGMGEWQFLEKKFSRFQVSQRSNSDKIPLRVKVYGFDRNKKPRDLIFHKRVNVTQGGQQFYELKPSDLTIMSSNPKKMAFIWKEMVAVLHLFFDKHDTDSKGVVAGYRTRPETGEKAESGLSVGGHPTKDKTRTVPQGKPSPPLGIFFKNYGTYDVKGSISRNEWEWSEEEECWGGGQLITFKVTSPNGKGKGMGKWQFLEKKFSRFQVSQRSNSDKIPLRVKVYGFDRNKKPRDLIFHKRVNVPQGGQQFYEFKPGDFTIMSRNPKRIAHKEKVAVLHLYFDEDPTGSAP